MLEEKIARLEAKLAKVTVERDGAEARCRIILDAKDRWLQRAVVAESALAAVLPDFTAWSAIRDLVNGDDTPAGDRSVVRAWLEQVAYHASRAADDRAAHPKTPDQPSVVAGLDNGVPPSRGDIGGPSGERVCKWRRFVPTSHPTKGKFVTCAGWLVRKDPAAVWCMYCGGKIEEVDVGATRRTPSADTNGENDA